VKLVGFTSHLTHNIKLKGKDSKHCY